MYSDLKELFDVETSKVEVKQAQAVIRLARAWATNCNEHIEFLGNALIGVPKIRFLTTDRENWFDQVLGTDEAIVKTNLDLVPGVDAAFNVTSDAFNLSIPYVTHKVFSNSKINKKLQQDAAEAAFTYLHYRFLSSLMNHYFRYEADRRVAEATYAALNRRYLLKQTGSWANLIDYRCKDILNVKGIHAKAIRTFRDDDAVRYCISDVQSRLREIVKALTTVFYEVAQSGNRIDKVSSTMKNQDGEMQIKDLQRKRTSFIRYAHDTVSSKDGFIKDELVDVVGDLIQTAPKHRTLEMLNYLTNNYSSNRDKEIKELVEATIQHAFSYIDANQKEFRRGIQLSVLLVKLKNLYLSSRSVDPLLMDMRRLSAVIAKRSVRSSNEALLSSVRTCTCLYIVARTFSMEFYSEGGDQKVVN